MGINDEPPSSQRAIGLVKKLGEVLIETLQKFRISPVEINHYIGRYNGAQEQSARTQEHSAVMPFYFFLFYL